jgi:hypothetical protein
MQRFPTAVPAITAHVRSFDSLWLQWSPLCVLPGVSIAPPWIALARFLTAGILFNQERNQFTCRLLRRQSF